MRDSNERSQKQQIMLHLPVSYSVLIGNVITETSVTELLQSNRLQWEIIVATNHRWVTCYCPPFHLHTVMFCFLSVVCWWNQESKQSGQPLPLPLALSLCCSLSLSPVNVTFPGSYWYLQWHLPPTLFTVTSILNHWAPTDIRRKWMLKSSWNLVSHALVGPDCVNHRHLLCVSQVWTTRNSTV